MRFRVGELVGNTNSRNVMVLRPSALTKIWVRVLAVVMNVIVIASVCVVTDV